MVISLALRPTTDSEQGWGKEEKRTRGGPGRRSRRRAGRQERTAVESPSINFHARIIIGKLESWLPDSRFVSPNESERVGAQRRAAAGGDGDSFFRLYAASSKSSMLRRAIIIVSLASFPPRGRPARQQIHADWDRARREPGSPLQARGECYCWRRGAALCPKAGAVCKQWVAAGAAGPPSRCPTLRALAARPPVFPPSPPTSVSCGDGEFTRRRGLGGGSPNRAGGSGPPFVKPTRGCGNAHTGWREE